MVVTLEMLLLKMVNKVRMVSLVINKVRVVNKELSKVETNKDSLEISNSKMEIKETL